MIKEFSFYHGVVFAMLLHNSSTPLIIGQYPSSDNASYTINDSIGIYIKYSTKRLSPWHFSFQNMHLSEIYEIDRKFEKVILLLVCRDDGIVGLTMEEFKQITDSAKKGTEWISVKRRPKEKYTVKGSLGTLSYKIGKTDFCEKILC